MQRFVSPPVLIRQGGLRFWWDRSHLVYVTLPDGANHGCLFVGDPGAEKATLDQVHDRIDEYVEEHG